VAAVFAPSIIVFATLSRDILGTNTPLSVAEISNWEEGSGVTVPIPTCAKRPELANIPKKTKIFLIMN
jgi:hypothetical protein